MSRHTYECHVRFSDVDVYGHVNNVKYFEYYQEARIAFLRSLSDASDSRDSSDPRDPRDPSDSEESGHEPSLRQVVARIDVDYKRPILFRPEPYLVESWVTGIGTSSYALDSRIIDTDGPDPTVYSTSQVRLVAFDTRTQRSRPLTDLERSRLMQARPAD
jgi:acyl-CoA thioester hydrolase